MSAAISGTARDRCARWWSARYSLITGHPLAARGTAALRIGYGTLWTLFLLREFGEREAAWGPGSAWSPAMERAYQARTPMFGWIRDWVTSVAGLGNAGFETFYALAMISGLLFALGWRTRISSLLFCFVVVALENRSPLITDGGDNVLMLMSIFLCFTRCGRHWSLDARRLNARRRADGARRPERLPRPDWQIRPDWRTRPEWRRELAAAREQAANVVHNGAVLVIAFQVCVIYATAGLSKVQGSMWQDGSAMGYVLQLRWFQPWPALDNWLLGHSLMLALFGYVTVFVQVGFPFAVFSPRLKYPSLCVLTLMHLSIAVLLGLPFFSLLMLTGDAVFLSDRVWCAVERRVAGPAYAGDMSTATVGTPTLVYDGDCAFCSTTVRLAERWCRPAVRFTPWQRLDLAAHGLTEEAVTSSVQWLRPRSDGRRIPSGAAAVGRVLLRSRWPFRPLGALLLVPPFSWLGQFVYRVISENRYRLPGGTPACAVGKSGESAVRAGKAAAGAAAETVEDEVPDATGKPLVYTETRLDDLLDQE